MSALDIVNTYYDAWINKRGDLSDVPLAEDFQFSGPVASFEDADGFRAMATQAGQAVTKFAIREQFVNGNRVCSIVDWEMALPVSPMTAAEILEVEGDKIVRGALIYDARNSARRWPDRSPDHAESAQPDNPRRVARGGLAGRRRPRRCRLLDPGRGQG